MTRRPHAQKLDRDDESFETTFTWMLSKVLGGAMFFFILAMAAQWGTMKGVTSTQVDLYGEKSPLMRSMGQVALAKPPTQPRETESLSRAFIERQKTLRRDLSSDVAHRT